MNRELTLDLQKFNASINQPPALHLAEVDENTEPAEPEAERTFFDQMLDIYDEDPERWDGLE